jgi:hypothetical protein
MNYFFLWTFVPCSIILPFIVGLINFRALKKPDSIIFIYITVNGLVNLVTSILARSGNNNMPVFHLFTIIELVLLSLFFSSIYNSKHYSIISYIVLAVFLVFAMLNSLFLQNIYMFNTYTRSLEAIIIICYCLWFFYYLISQETRPNNSLIWYTAGIFIYFSTSFIIFIMSNIALKLDKEQDWIMWHIHGSMVLLMYLFITKGLSIGKHRR